MARQNIIDLSAIELFLSVKGRVEYAANTCDYSEKERKGSMINIYSQM